MLDMKRVTDSLAVGLLSVLAGCASDQSKRLDTEHVGAMEVVHEAEGSGDEAVATRAPAEPADTAAGVKPALNDELPQGDACAPLPIYFETDSASLDEKARRRLELIAGCLERNEIDSMTVAGRTDPTGSEAYNAQLGLDRALSVAEYLASLGVPDEQIIIRSRGEQGASEDPIVWPTERRAELTVPAGQDDR